MTIWPFVAGVFVGTVLMWLIVLGYRSWPPRPGSTDRYWTLSESSIRFWLGRERWRRGKDTDP